MAWWHDGMMSRVDAGKVKAILGNLVDAILVELKDAVLSKLGFVRTKDYGKWEGWGSRIKFVKKILERTKVHFWFSRKGFVCAWSRKLDRTRNIRDR
jgi:hypothetical protein